MRGVGDRDGVGHPAAQSWGRSASLAVGPRAEPRRGAAGPHTSLAAPVHPGRPDPLPRRRRRGGRGGRGGRHRLLCGLRQAPQRAAVRVAGWRRCSGVAWCRCCCGCHVARLERAEHATRGLWLPTAWACLPCRGEAARTPAAPAPCRGIEAGHCRESFPPQNQHASKRPLSCCSRALDRPPQGGDGPAARRPGRRRLPCAGARATRRGRAGHGPGLGVDVRVVRGASQARLALCGGGHLAGVRPVGPCWNHQSPTNPCPLLLVAGVCPMLAPGCNSHACRSTVACRVRVIECMECVGGRKQAAWGHTPGMASAMGASVPRRLGCCGHARTTQTLAAREDGRQGPGCGAPHDDRGGWWPLPNRWPRRRLRRSSRRSGPARRHARARPGPAARGAGP